MRVQSLPFYTVVNNNYYKKNYSFKNSVNPNFMGQEYDIEISAGGVGLGPSCSIIHNGKHLGRETAGMYTQSLDAVKKAVHSICPGTFNVKEIKHCYPKGKLYVADPEETITQEIYDKYNYIATECQPDIPKLSRYYDKFHTYSPFPLDYNAVLGKIKAYYNRMLIADTKERARYNVKQIEDEINLKTAINNKKIIEGKLITNQALKGYYTEEMNKQDYFIYVNQEALKDDAEKIGYYDYKNNLTKQKIEFFDGILNIINKTGDAFIKRDIIATKRKDHVENYNNYIYDHIKLMTQIRATELEKEYLNKQIVIAEKYNKAITHQPEKGNHSVIMMNSPSEIIKTTNRVSHHYEEVQDAKKQIEDCDRKLKELTRERHKLQKSIRNEKVMIDKYTKEITPIINQIEPIYKELETYYKKNNPFNE